MTELDTLKSQLMSEIAAAADEAAIEAVRLSALGKKGSVSELLKTLGTMTPEERQTRGAAINQLKNEVTDFLTARKSELKDAAIEARLKAETLDVSLPVRQSPAERGRIHPISQIVDEITAIFADMGFSIAEGPDIETDYYNFTALNFPEGHPAREMHDTFFFLPDEKGERKVLRTHTSPVQVRTMEAQKPPIRIVIPGKTYRQDSDATHSPMFHQVEGLVIDKKAHVGKLRWILEEFCKTFFEVDSVVMRFRPSFFPFTEPSFEVDIQCDRSGPIIKVRRRQGLDGNPRLRHGAPQCAARRWARSGRVSGLCLGHGSRPHRHAEIRHAGPARFLQRRCSLDEPLRLPPARHADAVRRSERLIGQVEEYKL